MTSPYSFLLILRTSTSNQLSIDEKLLDQLSMFWNQHNQTANNNTIILSGQNLQKLLQYSTITILLYYDNQLIGSILAPLIPLKFKETTYLSGCITFLCLSQEYRSQGLCHMLINKLKEITNGLFINHGYYLNKSQTHPTDLPLKTWYRPINLLKARQAGFHISPFLINYPSQPKSINKLIKITPEMVDSSYLSLIDLISRPRYTNSVIFYPTRDQWASWISSFDTFLVFSSHSSKTKLKGIFSRKGVEVRVNEGQKMVTIALIILSIGKPLSILKGCVKVSEEFDVMYGYITGDMTADDINEIDGVITRTKVWVSFIDKDTQVKVDQLYIPLL